MTTPPDPAILLGGTTPHPAASPTEQALLDWAEANPIDRPRLTMDGTGRRYRAFPPDTDKERSYTRVTTFAEALDDTAGLTVWRHRLLAKGLATLTDELQACTDDRQRDAVVAKALHIAGEKLKADLGTAFHLAMEHAVMGTGNRPPAPYHLDVEATLAALEGAGIEPVVELCESQLWNPTFSLVGTADVLARGPWGERLRVCDYKTGSRIERNGHAIQMAVYANATHRFTGDGWEEVPPLDGEAGYIIHTPSGSGTCTIYEVGLALGDYLANMAAGVREVRKDAAVKKLFTHVNMATAHQASDEIAAAMAAVDEIATTVASNTGRMVDPYEATPEPPAATEAPDGTSWLVERVRTLAAANAEAKGHLARRWPEGCPTVPPWSEAQMLALGEVLAPLEVAVGIEAPFPPLGSVFAPLADEAAPSAAPADEAPVPPGMWQIDDEPGLIDHDLATAIEERFAALDGERKALAATWARDAKAGSRPWAITRDDLTPRVLAISAAILAALTAFWDSDGAADCDLLTRAALSLAIGEDVQPGWRTGAVLGALTIDQARRLDEMAVAFSVDQHTAAEVGAKALALAA